MCPQMLVQYGAAVNRTDRNGCTPLYKAAYHGRPVLVDMLVKAGMSALQCCCLYTIDKDVVQTH